MNDIKKIYLSYEKLYYNQEKKILKENNKIVNLFLKEGTIKDKKLSLVKLCKDNPDFCLTLLKNFFDNFDKKGKKEKLNILEEIKNLFISELKDNVENFDSFENLLKKKKLPKEKAYFLSNLKNIVNTYLIKTEKLMFDNVEHFKRKSYKFCQELFYHLKNNNQYFLKPIMKKFGDKDEFLIQTIQKDLDLFIIHNKEKSNLIILALKEILNNENLSVRTLNQIITTITNIKFDSCENYISKDCFTIFINLFKKIMKEENQEDKNKTLNQLIRGLNRILPNIKISDSKEFFEENVNVLFKLCHQSKDKIRIQIFIFIFSIVKEDLYSKMADRFYRAVYESLSNLSIFHSSINEILFDLLYSIIKNDINLIRIKAFIKRILQNVIHLESQIIISSLIFINKISEIHPGINSLFESNDEILNELDDDIQLKDKDDNLADNNGYYKPFERNPLISNSNYTCLWEIIFLTNHYHPVVKKITLNLLNKNYKENEHKGNPLLDYAMAKFYKRFSSKKPKINFKMKKIKNKSLKLSRLEKEDPFTLSYYLNNQDTNKHEEEKFIKTFFDIKIAKNLVKEKKKIENSNKDPEQEMDEFADRLFENEIDKMNPDFNFDELENNSLSMDEEDEEEEEDYNSEEENDIGNNTNNNEFNNIFKQDNNVSLDKRQ